MKMNSENREPMEGFPLPLRERKALDTFLGDGVARPKGVAGGTLTNLHTSRHWIERVGRSEEIKDYGEPLYSTTAAGRLAIEIDEYFTKAGFCRPNISARAAGTNAYKDLAEKWRQVRNSTDQLPTRRSAR